jgi:uncharacterized membrane protein YphA (DoxX/SURF4 family)
VKSNAQPGIYVEIFICQGVERIWELTQTPELHERWDLRFGRIRYLPRASPAEPQRFLYETQIGFGLKIQGTGQSIGQRGVGGADTTSSLEFASEDPKSLIRNGSGYWRYVRVESGLRFLTWYDYSVRYGGVGKIVDRVAFRPLIGWATAWSFDRLRLWAETGQTPELSMDLSVVHAVARVTVAFVWIWHGLVPKLIFQHADERAMLSAAAVPLTWLAWLGAGEIVLGLLVLVTWNMRVGWVVNALLMVLATVAVALKSPEYFRAAFNPMTLNAAMVALSIVGWFASRRLPSARRCLRRDPRLRA